MKKKTNIKVTPRRKESQERMIKRFIKKCKKQGIIDEIKDRRYFKSNSEKKNEVKREPFKPKKASKGVPFTPKK